MNVYNYDYDIGSGSLLICCTSVPMAIWHILNLLEYQIDKPKAY